MRNNIAIASAALALMTTAAWAEAPKYAADVPDNVKTPDVVETETLGNLKFFDGTPDAETVQTAYDNLDLIRATTAFLDGI